MSDAAVDVQVGSLARRHVGDAGRLLAAAFDEDPVIGYFLPKSARRRVVLPGFFRSTIEAALPLGGVYAVTASGRLLGAAVWFPPAVPGDPTKTPWRSRVAMQPARLVYGKALSRLLAGFELLSDHHPSDPHWYLAFVGIAPSGQSQGLGAQALAPVLQKADRAGQCCYLETPFPRTHPFYERLGFERVDELRAFGDAPAVVTFLRRPRPVGS